MLVLMLKKYYNSCLSTLVTVTMKNALNFSQIYFRIKGLSSSTKCNLVKRILICRGKIRLFRERLLEKKMLKVHATTSKAIVGSFQGTVP